MQSAVHAIGRVARYHGRLPFVFLRHVVDGGSMVGAYAVVLLAAAIGFNQDIGKALSFGWGGLDQRLWWTPVVVWALWGVLKANFDQWDAERSRADQLQQELSGLRDSFRWLLTVQTSVIAIGRSKADESKVTAQAGIVLYNGSNVPMRYEVQEMTVNISGVAADQVESSRRAAIILPYQTTQYLCPPIPDVPYVLPIAACVAFTFTYGPAAGSQLYETAGEFNVVATEAVDGGQLVSRFEWVKQWTCEPLATTPSQPPTPSTPTARPQ
jgi:hypothetical protein